MRFYLLLCETIGITLKELYKMDSSEISIWMEEFRLREQEQKKKEKELSRSKRRR